MIRKIPDEGEGRQDAADARGGDAPAASGGEGRRLASDEDDDVGAHADAEQPADEPADADSERAADESLDADASPPAGDVARPPVDRPLPQRLEAVLFAAGSSLSAAKLARVLGEELEAVKAALEELVEQWSAREGAIDLVEISGGWRFMTRPAFADDLTGLARKGKLEKLSPAALETLAIVAYRQPLGRADIEAIRGVQAGPLLRVLLDRDLIRIAGRSPEPGHPLLYGTTKRFLDHFGLPSLKALPDIKDLLDVS